MKHIFVDFEMHPIGREYKKERKICSREIIEFGAIMLDEELNEVSMFKQYVKPKYNNNVYTKISELTGITYSMLVGAKLFNEVFVKFVEWCYSLDDEITVYAWSNSDLSQLNKEIELKSTYIDEMVQKMFSNWVDLQKEYCELVHSKNMISLEKALSSIGEYFVGNMHDAVCDARNTAEIYKATRDRELFVKEVSFIKEGYDHSDDNSITFSLGDLFNFGAYQFAIV